MADGRSKQRGGCKSSPVTHSGWRSRRRAEIPRASGCFSVIVCAVAVMASSQAQGTDLTMALGEAYETSPLLDAERARLRATDEGVARAKSGWRPRVQGQASYGRSHRTLDPNSNLNGMSTPLNYGLTVTQPVFDGFQTLSAVRGAEARVRAGQQQLRQTETNVLLEAVTAFMNVVRDRQLVSIDERNLSALSEEVRAARARRTVREVTLTDVAQAEARRAEAQARLDQATANLKSSEAEYRRRMGGQPGKLKAPAMSLRLLPASRRKAIDIAMRESPGLALARFQLEAAKHDVSREFGALLPNVRVEARVDEEHGGNRTTDYDRTASVFGRVTVPLYAGGETRARVRAAKHQRIGRIRDLEDARRRVRSQVIAAWSQLVAGRARVKSGKIRVRAAATALKGVRAEQAVGQRTLLDLLNAQQELLDARAALVRARRDTVVAQYRVLAEIGSLDAAILRLDAPIYDPRAHASEAADAWLSISVVEEAETTPNTGAPDNLASKPRLNRQAHSKVVRAAKPPMRLGLRGTAGRPATGSAPLTDSPKLRRAFPR